MAIDIEAYEGPAKTRRCFASLRYLFPEYHEFNKDLLDLTYNTFGVAKDLPAILGLEPDSEPDGIIKINWNVALDNVLDILQHRDQIGSNDYGFAQKIATLANFVMTSYRCSLFYPDPKSVVIKWSA